MIGRFLTRRGQETIHGCRICKVGFIYGDSVDRHMRERHPKAALKEQRRRERDARQRMANASKHKRLCADVVEAALAFDRKGASFWLIAKDNMPLAKELGRACAALEEFETKGLKLLPLRTKAPR